MTTATTKIREATTTLGKYAKTSFKKPASWVNPNTSTAASKNTISKDHLKMEPIKAAASTLMSAFARASSQFPFSKILLKLTRLKMSPTNFPTATEMTHPIKKMSNAPTTEGRKPMNPCHKSWRDSRVIAYQSSIIYLVYSF